jgi:hypothetical protein
MPFHSHELRGGAAPFEFKGAVFDSDCDFEFSFAAYLAKQVNQPRKPTTRVIPNPAAFPGG